MQPHPLVGLGDARDIWRRNQAKGPPSNRDLEGQSSLVGRTGSWRAGSWRVGEGSGEEGVGEGNGRFLLGDVAMVSWSWGQFPLRCFDAQSGAGSEALIGWR